MSKVVLITGCSTGIGRDLAQRLQRAGYCVVATARRLDALDDLNAALKLQLDVTRDESVRQAVARTLQHFGRIDILVNNAGYAIRGAVEEVSEEETQRIFDVNVFGALRMMQAVIPYMRSQGTGRMINLSSIAGRLSTPANGMYSATKFALEALSDALRIELAPFGIQVVVVEPGAIKTHFHDTAQAHAKNILSNAASPYRLLYEKSDQFAADMRHNEPGPDVVSKVIQQAIEASRPRALYFAAIPLPTRLVLYLRDFVWHPVLRQMFSYRAQSGSDQAVVPVDRSQVL